MAEAKDGDFRVFERLQLLWPGAARLFAADQVGGLLIGAVFALLLGVSLIAHFVWPELLTANIRSLSAVLACGTWLLGLLDARQVQATLRRSRGLEPLSDLFLASRSEYLRGDFVAAESGFSQIVARHPEDVSSRLMLATLYRHQDRLKEAREQLRRLQRWRAASTWQMEIRQEWERISRREFAAETDTDRRSSLGQDQVSARLTQSEAA